MATHRQIWIGISQTKGVEELLLLPMFPHYAQATTESALKHAYKQLKLINWQPKIIEMGHFETDEEYVIPLTKSIQSQIDKDTHLFLTTDYLYLTPSESTNQKITVSDLIIAVQSSPKQISCATDTIVCLQHKLLLACWD